MLRLHWSGAVYRRRRVRTVLCVLLVRTTSLRRLKRECVIVFPRTLSSLDLAKQSFPKTPLSQRDANFRCLVKAGMISLGLAAPGGWIQVQTETSTFMGSSTSSNSRNPRAPLSPKTLNPKALNP